MNPQLRLPGSLAEVSASPEGPEVGAFFDMDGTLIHGQTGRYIMQERRRRGEFGSSELLRSLALTATNGNNPETFAAMLDLGGAAWRGRAHEDLVEMGLRVFERDIRPMMYPEMRAIVDAHHRRGHTVVLSSAASDYQADPVARYLGIENVLCNHYVAEDGVLTGVIQRPVLYGPGKANVVQAFAAQRDVDLNRSYFYADGDEDVALMYLVGHPRPTNPGKQLAKVAHKRGWPVLRFPKPGEPRSLIRLATAVPRAGLSVVRRVATPIWSNNRSEDE